MKRKKQQQQECNCLKTKEQERLSLFSIFQWCQISFILTRNNCWSSRGVGANAGLKHPKSNAAKWHWVTAWIPLPGSDGVDGGVSIKALEANGFEQNV